MFTRYIMKLIISQERVLNDYNYMKSIAKKYIKKYDYEKALRSIFVACGFMYTYSQIYCDDELEMMVKQIGSKFVSPDMSAKRSKKSVLFYDGFGNDNRGLAVIYLKALKDIGFRITYVTYAHLAESIGHIKQILGVENIIYIENIDFVKQIKELNEIVNKVNALKLMIYMCPDDVVASGVFSQYEGIMERFLINLTDHAFWLGKATTDYIIEFRNYGANISHQQRKLRKDSIYCLPFYPNVIKSNFAGFPFEYNGKKIVFSGGALYKTYGIGNLYYSMVEKILDMDSDVIFYYAGEGDTTELSKLIRKYPQRVYYSRERADFYEVMKRCYLYLSTYPYFGGLMTLYAIHAGKLPMTLASEEFIGEQVVESDEDVWYFRDCDKMLKEIKVLLNNEDYLKKQEAKIKDGIIEPEQFADELADILENHYGNRKISWKAIDVDKTKNIIMERTKKSEYCGLFCRVRAPFFVKFFPIKFMYGFVVNVHNQIADVKRRY